MHKARLIRLDRHVAYAWILRTTQQHSGSKLDVKDAAETAEVGQYARNAPAATGAPLIVAPLPLPTVSPSPPGVSAMTCTGTPSITSSALPSVTPLPSALCHSGRVRRDRHAADRDARAADDCITVSHRPVRGRGAATSGGGRHVGAAAGDGALEQVLLDVAGGRHVGAAGVAAEDGVELDADSVAFWGDCGAF